MRNPHSKLPRLPDLTQSLSRGLALGLTFSVALCSTAVGQRDLEMGKMWTFENPPLGYLEKEYGFKPDQKWLNSLRMASLRFGGGCSASFVSPKGLIMTNHHCVRGSLALAQGEEDWIKNGFYATALGDEVRMQMQTQRGPAPLTVQQLISSKDVTDQVNAGIADTDDDATVTRMRQANIAQIRKAARTEHPDLTPQVIKMHQGALYQLYSYKIYSDVRLVCSPHLQTSHFGGDPDNFTYPRFGIDFTFCRAYENGEPADTSKHYFRWSKAGPRKGELAFVTGNPGSTGRLQTKGQMEFLRESSYPMTLDRLDDELRIVKAAAAKDPIYEKRTRTLVLSRENSQKATRGYLAGLHNAGIQSDKTRAESEFRKKVQSDKAMQAKWGGAWQTLTAISKNKQRIQPHLNFYIPYYSAELLRAASLVVATDPSAPEQARAAASQQARAPMIRSATRDKLFAAHLVRAKKWLGDADPYVRSLLGTGTAEEAIARLKKSIVTDDAAIQKLLDGGREALSNSDDAAIRAAMFFVPARRKAGAESVELTTSENVQGAKIGRALFACYGNSVSPDATFSLRFSDGVVKGFPMNGTLAPYRTTFYGLFARNAEFDNEYPFNLPKVWLDRRDKIDMKKGVCFVATNDIIGGNSGSPIVNKQLEVIGLIFDGNIEMLGNRFLYKDDVPRSVSVHSEAIIESMAKIYDAQRIVDEIMAGSESGGSK